MAVRFTSDGEAWKFNELHKVWEPMNAADAVHKARVLTETDFNEMFPDLPALPPEAFKA
jgi:hypothetical protein